MILDSAVQAALKRLVDEAHLLKIILFGSYARQEAKDESETDKLHEMSHLARNDAR